MKHHPTLPTKRQPLRQSVVKRLFANIPGRKKHRAATTANPADFETELPGRKIGNALAVIVAVHVAAAGLVFFHHWRLEGRGGDAVAKPDQSAMPETLFSSGNTSSVPVIAPSDQRHLARTGETYAVIAEKLGVEESDLRVANSNQPIQSGLLMKIPPKRIVAKVSDEALALSNNAPAADRGIVEIPLPEVVEERPQLIKPSPEKVTEHTVAAKPVERTVASLPKPAAEKPAVSAPKPTAGGRSYTVQSGDNFWRIANKYKIDPDKLMKANGISDAKKLRIGMNLVIPN